PESPPCVRSIDGAVASRRLRTRARRARSPAPRRRCVEAGAAGRRGVVDRRRRAARKQRRSVRRGRARSWRGRPRPSPSPRSPPREDRAARCEDPARARALACQRAARASRVGFAEGERRTSMTFHAHDRALDLLRSIRPLLPRLCAADKSLEDQLRRAATNVLLNIAEANRRKGRDRANRFRWALAEAAE